MTSALGFAEIAVVYIDASGRMAGDRDIYVNGRWIGEAPGRRICYFLCEGFDLRDKAAPFGGQSPGWDKSAECIRVQIGNHAPVLITNDLTLVFCPTKATTAMRVSSRLNRALASQGDVSSLYTQHPWIKRGGKFYPP